MNSDHSLKDDDSVQEFFFKIPHLKSEHEKTRFCEANRDILLEYYDDLPMWIKKYLKFEKNRERYYAQKKFY